MLRGEVWRVRLPFAGGREQAGERPAVVIQSDEITLTLPMVFIIPLTGETAASRFHPTLLIEPDHQNGLTRPLVALVFQARSLDKRRFVTRLGKLNEETLLELFVLLDRLTGG